MEGVETQERKTRCSIRDDASAVKTPTRELKFSSTIDFPRAKDTRKKVTRKLRYLFSPRSKISSTWTSGKVFLRLCVCVIDN